MSAARLLELFGVEGAPDVYVLGISERRLTIYAQQCRALNLVSALREDGRLASTTKAAVVGAGIGGLTAAAALARLGVEVRVLERASRLMPLQIGSHTRFVHPHIYEWPRAGWDDPQAGLPILDWTANAASRVVHDLREQVDRLCSNGTLAVACGATLTNISSAGTAVTLTWDSPGFHTDRFDVAILAVGFGEERESAHSHSYWHDDDLHQLESGSVLVSGTGDGGLTDVLRAAISGFEHSELPALLSGQWLPGIAARVEEVENDLSLSAAQLTAIYRNELLVPDVLEALRHRVEARDTNVTLNAPGAAPFGRSSAPLNRFLVSHLMELGVAYRPGRISVTHSGDRPLVRFENQGAVAEQDFDRVVLRHGVTDPPIGGLPVRPKLTPQTAAGLPITTDVTRWPAWPDDFAQLLSAPPPPAPARREVARTSSGNWQVLDAAALDSFRAVATEEDLFDFVDGRDPEWPDIASARVPERRAVQTIAKELARRLRTDAPGISRISGPSGEGKSTILMQVVMRAVRDGLRPTVLWRTGPATELPWGLMERAQSDRPLLIVADQGHDIGELLGRSTVRNRLTRFFAERSSVSHILLCTTDADWAGARTDRPWSGVQVHEPWRIQGLTSIDAARIVTGLRRMSDPERALGELARLGSDEARVAAMVRSAQQREDADALGAFLGALLIQRTGRSIEEHVRHALERFAAARLPSGHSALAVYLQISALQALALGAIERDVLANALDVRIQSVEGLVRAAVSTEASIRGFGAETRYKIRHDAIAAVAWKFASENEQWRAEAREAIYEVVRATVALNPEGWRELREIFYLGRRLSDDPDFAVAAAEGAHDGAPDNPYLLSNLAWTHRELDVNGGASRGAAIIEERLDRLARGPEIRACYAEWAACLGVASSEPASELRSFVLAVYSLSDEAAPAGLPSEHVPTALGEAARALLALHGRGAGFDDPKYLAAILTLAGNRRLNHRDQIEAIVGDTARPTRGAALGLLADAFVQAREAAEPPVVPRAGGVTFDLFAGAVGA
ncbi:MAG TPA: FAD-dependent oxidoreductase [Solirubrobacteraceae bacterium]|nr:FAD-dependent oxidoreductase [Solirubrobacteraceae bacterium]